MERRSHGKPEIPGVSGFSVGPLLVGLVENGGRGDLGREVVVIDVIVIGCHWWCKLPLSLKRTVS